MDQVQIVNKQLIHREIRLREETGNATTVP
jgi:hypothetical protein